MKNLHLYNMVIFSIKAIRFQNLSDLNQNQNSINKQSNLYIITNILYYIHFCQQINLNLNPNLNLPFSQHDQASLATTNNATATSNNSGALNRLMSPTKTAINSRLARFKSLSSGNSGQVCET